MAVRQFVAKHLHDPQQSFALIGHHPNGTGRQQFGSAETTLLDYGLVPTSLLYFEHNGMDEARNVGPLINKKIAKKIL